MLDQPKIGTLVGRDALGNEYYQNRAEIANRDRWVWYAKWHNDASQVPPEWYVRCAFVCTLCIRVTRGMLTPHAMQANAIRHQWLHHITDDVPTAENAPRPFYSPPHREHATATVGAFKTYSTVKPKLEAWVPTGPGSERRA
jgi:NADH:ubiquinone oxidoreductase subunit